MAGSASTLGVASGPTPPAPEAAPLAVTPAAPVVAAPAWPRPAQWATIALLITAMSLLGWQVGGAQRWGARPTDLGADAADSARVDLNHADRAELLQLPGVGAVTARRIEEYRQAHDGFRGVDDLRKVQGVGTGLLERLRPLVEVSPLEDDADAKDAPRPPPAAAQEAPSKSVAPAAAIPAGGRKKGEDLARPVDLNRATAGELQRLPGIGPALSGRIVQARERQPFQSVDELRRVPGIGPKTLEHLRPFVVVNDEPPRP